MPIYDYHCDHCGHTFSAVQSYTDNTLDVCPSCGKVPRKLMATPAIVFKGGGWYKTDSRPTPKDGQTDGPKETKKETKEGATAGKGGGGSSTESADSGKGGASAPAEHGAVKSDTSKADTPKPAPKPATPKGDSASS